MVDCSNEIDWIFAKKCRIASFSYASITTGVGMLSSIYRVTPTYIGEKGPATFVVKLPSMTPQTREFTRVYKAGLRELWFYQKLASEEKDGGNFRSVTVYYKDYQEATGNFILIMFDMGPYATFGDQITGVSEEQMTTAVLGLAEFHGRWAPRVQGGDERAPMLITDVPIQTAKMYLPLAIEPFLQLFGQKFTDRQKELTRKLSRSMDGLCKRLYSERIKPAMTVTHGDYRADNFLFHDPKRINGTPFEGSKLTVVDWQICVTAPGPFDLGYCIVQSCVPEIRRKIEKQLVKEYHSIVLKKANVTEEEYPFELCWETYRFSILLGFSYNIVGGGALVDNPKAAMLIQACADRAIAAIEDHGCWEFLDDHE